MKIFEKNLYTFTGCVGLLFVNSMFYFVPQFPLVGLTALQGGMIIQEFLESKWKKIFLNLGLFNSDKVTPQLIRKEKNDLGDRFIFSIPTGLCLSDFEKMQEELETILQKPLKIELTNNFKLMIQVFDIKYKNIYEPSKEVYCEISDRGNDNI